MRDLTTLPNDLPEPTDDGEARHLLGVEMPDVELEGTNGPQLMTALGDRAVLFIYPAAGSPLEPAPNEAEWNSIPGARGCTPQSCSFRDTYSQFTDLGVKVYGLSVQPVDVQEEFSRRNHIPFSILSDSDYDFTDALKLPSFEFNNRRLLKRMVLCVEKGLVAHLFYPVFPPSESAAQVLSWLSDQRKATSPS